MKGIVAVSAAVLLGALVGTQAHATHYQFVETSLEEGQPVVLDATGGSWEWTFDLLTDDMALWEISTHYDSSNATPTGVPDAYGSYDPLAALHYVTLRIDPCNTSGVPTSTYLDLYVNGIEIADWGNPIRIYEWGVPGGSPSDPYGLAGNDYQVEVRLTSSGGDAVTLTNVNVEGCFDTAAPVPEPATLVLLGSGLVGLAGAARRRQDPGA